MFYPRYNYSKGLIRPAGRRVAAVSRTHQAGGQDGRVRTAQPGSSGGLMGAGGGGMQAYSPVYERAEDPTLAEEFLPTDTQTQNKIFRNIIMYDPVAGPATEYWRDLAFSKRVRLGGVEDKKVLQFYQDAIESSNVEYWMPWLLNDYLTFGRFVMQLDFDPSKGYWTQLIIHDLDYVEIIASPFPSEDPLINVQPKQQHREWAVSRDPRVVEQREKYDPDLVRLMALGDPYPLPAEHTLFMPRRTSAADNLGTSYLTRIIPFKIMEKALIDAEISAARRRAGPVWVINVPEDYEADEIQEIIDQFFAIEEDPIGGKVAVREGVTVNPIGGGKSDFWTLSDEYDFLKTAKLNALGISNSFLEGEASYSSMEKDLQVFVEKLRAIRSHFTETVIVNKMLKGLARMHGHAVSRKPQVAHHYRIAKREIADADLMIPTVEWDRPLEPHADLDYWDLLERLEAKGIPVPKRKWAQAAGYDFDEGLEAAPSDMDDRAKLYQIKAAQAQQAEANGFDLEGNVLAGGEIGGGGGGIGDGDFGELPPGEDFELGGDEGGFDLSTPPDAMELPSPDAGGGDAAPEGAGASLDSARFPVRDPRGRFRRAMPDDYRNIEDKLAEVSIWTNDHYLGLKRRQVAQLVDRIAHTAPQHRNGRYLARWLHRQGLDSVQACTVQYCACRLGYLREPHLDQETIRYLQATLVDQANEQGLTPALSREFELLTRVAEARSKMPVAGPRSLTSRELPEHRVLTGIV